MIPSIVVIGSANTDMVVKVQRLPQPGETLLGGEFFIARGGKGANQAVAAARLGGRVSFIACLGRDSFGQDSVTAYQSEGIDTTFITWDENQPSGVALIMVESSGDNMIAVAPGANQSLSSANVEAAEAAIRSADCVLLQLEIPMETVEAAARITRKHHKRLILNPAPAAALSAELLRNVDVLTPNEKEAALLAGGAGEGLEEIARSLLEQSGVKELVLTLGERGSLVAAEQLVLVPAFPVQPVDATAAGDAFNGALAVALARGFELVHAARYANAAGALATTRAGAQPSLPFALEVESFLSSFEAGSA